MLQRNFLNFKDLSKNTPICEYSNYFSAEFLRSSKVFREIDFFMNQGNITVLILLIICSVLLYDKLLMLLCSSSQCSFCRKLREAEYSH